MTINYFLSHILPKGVQKWLSSTVPLLGRPAFRNPRPLLQGQVWRKEDLPLVEENHVRAHLGKCATMAPDGRHAWVLRVLADVTVRPLLIVFETSWDLGDIPGEWMKADVTPIFEKRRKMIQGTSQPHFVPWEGYKATNLVNHLQ